MNSKKAVLGNIMIMVVATIAIVIILFLFVMASGFLRKMNFINDEIEIAEADSVGLKDMSFYSQDYFNLVETRFLIEKGYSLNDALRESENEG